MNDRRLPSSAPRAATADASPGPRAFVPKPTPPPFRPLLWVLGAASLIAVIALCAITGTFVANAGNRQASSVASTSADQELARDGGPMAEATLGDEESAISPDAMRSLRGNNWMFSIPAQWRDVTDYARGHGDGVVRAARAPHAKAGFYPNVNLHIEAFPDDSKAYFSQNLEAVGRVASIRTHRTVEGTLPAHFEIEAVWMQGDVPTHTLQRLLSRDGRGYMLTCSSAAGAFEHTRALCETILDSLVVTSPPR